MLEKCYRNFLRDGRFVIASKYRCRVAVSNALCSVRLLYAEIMAGMQLLLTDCFCNNDHFVIQNLFTCMACIRSPVVLSPSIGNVRYICLQ